MKIPFVDINRQNREIKEALNKAFNNVLDSNWYVLGKNVEEFEKMYAEYSGTNYCIGTGNCLESLHLSLKALGIKAGDEVIVPSNTYIATWLAVTYVGATIVPVEPDEYYNISVDNVRKSITKKTKAIMAVNLFGLPCKYDELVELAKEYDLYIVEDNAQSQGASYKGVKTGAWGHINSTSFYPMKNLGAYGDGGAITTNSLDLEQKIRSLRNYGSVQKYVNEEIGYNSRLDELQAAFLKIKLEKLDAWNADRRRIAEIYSNELANTGDIVCPGTYKEAEHVFHVYVVRTNKRDELQSYLASKNIGTLIHYPIPPYLQKAYKDLGYQKGDFPIAELFANTMLSLPIFPGMKNEEIEYVVNTIKEFYK